MESEMTISLNDFSESLAGLIENASRQVLRVDGRHRFPASGIAWAAGGVIVTAHHVLERDDSISVGLSEKDSVPAVLVGRDPTTDLAVLRAEGLPVNPAERATAGDLKVGHLVVALGRPGNRVRASLGMISAAGDTWKTAAGGTVDRYLQTSVEMLPGFSGGPLLDMQGRLIGLNTSALQRDGSLVIPVDTLDRVAKSLLSHGRIRRSYLGITSQPVRLGEAAAKEHNQTSGLIVIGIESGGPAESAGILQGDILLTAGGMPTRRIEDLVAALTVDDPSAPLTAKVLRGGAIHEISVKPVERE